MSVGRWLGAHLDSHGSTALILLYTTVFVFSLPRCGHSRKCFRHLSPVREIAIRVVPRGTHSPFPVFRPFGPVGIPKIPGRIPHPWDLPPHFSVSPRTKGLYPHGPTYSVFLVLSRFLKISRQVCPFHLVFSPLAVDTYYFRFWKGFSLLHGPMMRGPLGPPSLDITPGCQPWFAPPLPWNCCHGTPPRPVPFRHQSWFCFPVPFCCLALPGDLSLLVSMSRDFRSPLPPPPKDHTSFSLVPSTGLSA